jgi:hypothetical protein
MSVWGATHYLLVTELCPYFFGRKMDESSNYFVTCMVARFGLATNGEEFRFVKLQSQDDRALVDLSAILSVMPPSRSQLPQVVQILKSLADS